MNLLEIHRPLAMDITMRKCIDLDKLAIFSRKVPESG
jgi:hypothetical protein